MLKSHSCGELRKEYVGQHVRLAGWVNRRREMGGLIFIDLRDRWGVTQVVVDESESPGAHQAASDVRLEYVVQIEGEVTARAPEAVNPKMPTGEIEVRADSIKVLNAAKTPVFEIASDQEPNETLRMKYRYLDLRRARMQRNLLLRHNALMFIRNFLNERGFVEIETPILFKSTPEGARDYLVPSRVHPGQFYALPQSPQQLKQLLMVAGFERYFQIARCFRDEDQRGDRQPEFTQLDMEMSFVEREDVLQLIGQLMTQMVETVSDRQILFRPFPRLSYTEALEHFGTDRPDLRFGLELKDVSAIASRSEFKVFTSAVEAGNKVRALVAPGLSGYSRKEISELEEIAKEAGAKGLATMASSRMVPYGPQSPSSSLRMCCTNWLRRQGPSQAISYSLRRTPGPSSMRHCRRCAWPSERDSDWPIQPCCASHGSSISHSSNGTTKRTVGIHPTTCLPHQGPKTSHCSTLTLGR